MRKSLIIKALEIRPFCMTCAYHINLYRLPCWCSAKVYVTMLAQYSYSEFGYEGFVCMRLIDDTISPPLPLHTLYF